MKPLKIVAIVVVAYAATIVAFESLIGFLQPADESTLVLTTLDGDGVSHDRVLSPLEGKGELYVATNHWTRGWYYRVLENPVVYVTLEGRTGAYEAVPVTGVERDRVASENKLGLVLRLLTGFPPRHFVRLDPR